MQNGDSVAADRFGERLVSRCVELTEAPGSGVATSFGFNVRKIVEGSYQIYYRVQGDDLFILRIWDGRRGSNPRI